MYTNTPRTILTLGAALLLVAGLQGPAHAGTSELATVSTSSGGIHWQPLVATDGWTLTVAGEERWIRSQFGPGESPTFQPADESGQPLPDGSYTWELRAVYSGSGGDPNAAANGRDGAADTSRTRAEPPGPQTQSGAFTIVNGAIAVEETETGMGAKTGGDAAAGETQQVVFNDDLIVQGSACVGFDCSSSESFGFDTLRLKENNTRLQFNDTSSAGSFPTNNWQIRANSSANGGANFLAFVDQGANGSSESGTIVFSVAAGAGANALHVDSAGDVGVGTATPALDLHVATGDTPGLRLEQDGSSGFTPQTWDVAGNESNFFVRDATGGSTLPFRIFPGSPSSSLVVRDGDVGIGTSSPDGGLHVVRTGAGVQNMVRLDATGSGGRPRLIFTNPNGTWFYETNGDNFDIHRSGSGAPEELQLQANGDLIIAGTLTELSSRTAKEGIVELDPADVLARVVELPVPSWTYIDDEERARHVGPMAEDFYQAFQLGEDASHISPSDKAGVALLAIQGLQQELTKRDARIEELTQEKAALEERMSKLEHLVEALAEE